MADTNKTTPTKATPAKAAPAEKPTGDDWDKTGSTQSSSQTGNPGEKNVDGVQPVTNDNLSSEVAKGFDAGHEHTIGDDPARTAQLGYHCSMCGRPVNAEGTEHLTDSAGQDGDVSQHRIMAVADDWPSVQLKIDDPAKRKTS